MLSEKNLKHSEKRLKHSEERLKHSEKGPVHCEKRHKWLTLMMGKEMKDTPWELAQRDPHLMRLGDYLATQMGPEAMAKLELELELDWDWGGREAIMRRMEAEYLSDQQDQCIWHLSDHEDQCHWRCHWQEKPRITMIVDPQNYARPFVTMWTSKEQSHTSCEINMLRKKAVISLENVKQGQRTTIIGQMKEKVDEDDMKRTQYKHWEEHERGGKMRGVFKWKLHSTQSLQTNNSDDQLENSLGKKKVTKKLDEEGNMCQEDINPAIRKILGTTRKSKVGRKHSQEEKNKNTKTTAVIPGWQGPRDILSEKQQKKKTHEKKNKEKETEKKKEKDETNQRNKSNPSQRVGREGKQENKEQQKKK